MTDFWENHFNIYVAKGAPEPYYLTDFDENVIRPLDRPLFPTGGLVVLRGNLAPDGCILKRSAATPALLHHVGKAVVFKDYEDMKARIDDPDLDVDADSVLVLQGSGVRGVPGMPEWGMLPIPKKLLRQGVDDMVRVSDARMSGTHFGTVALHVSPESAAGGPLAFVRDGDLIELDVDKRRLQLLVDDAELEERRRRWVAPAPRHDGQFRPRGKEPAAVAGGARYRIPRRDPRPGRERIAHPAHRPL